LDANEKPDLEKLSLQNQFFGRPQQLAKDWGVCDGMIEALNRLGHKTEVSARIFWFVFF